MDADLATDISELKKFWNKRTTADCLIGNRKNENNQRNVIRDIAGSISHGLVNTVLNLKLKDTQCGFKAFSREATGVIFPLQTIDSWGFDMEVLAIARKRGYSIGLIEVPDWKDVKEGSKISGNSPIKASLQTFGDLLKIRWGFLCGRYKIKK